MSGWSSPLLILLYGPSLDGPLAVLAQGVAAAEKQLQLAIWAAGGLSLIVFLIMLFAGRRKLEAGDKLQVDWEREEERMRKIAELRKAARSPDEQRRLTVADPGVRHAVAPPLLPDSPPATSAPAPPAAPAIADPATPAPGSSQPESEWDRLLRGLSD